MRVAIAMSVIISLAFVGMLSSFFIAETSEGFGAAINQAGTLRMQSYRIASSLVHFDATDTPYSAATTRQLVNEFEQRLLSSRIHNVVSEGASPSIRQAYNTVENQWRETIRPSLESYINSTGVINDRKSLRKAYLSDVDQFVGNIHHFVKVLEIGVEEKIQQLRVIQITALVLTLLVILIVMRLMHRDVMQPLRDLMESARAIRQGDFSLHTQPKGEDELAQLGYAFNTMSENLARMYA